MGLGLIVLMLGMHGPAADSPGEDGVFEVGLISGYTIPHCSIVSVKDSVVEVTENSGLIALPIDSIVYCKRRVESHLWAGAGYGAVAGFIVGTAIGYATYSQPGGTDGPGDFTGLSRAAATFSGSVIGVATGFVLGGIIGASMSGDEMYILAGRSHVGRRQILQILASEPRGQ